MNWGERITVDPAVLVGKPIVKGTRLAVEFVLGLVAAGWTVDQIVSNYPGLSAEDVRACVAHAKEVMEESSFLPTRDQRDRG